MLGGNHAERGVEQEADAAGQELHVLLEREHVALGGVDAGVDLGLAVVLLGDILEVVQHAIERGRAFLGPGDEVALLAGAFENDVETGIAIPAARLHVEDRQTEAIDFVLQVLDQIGLALDQCFQKADQDAGAVEAGRVALFDALQE